MEWENVTSEYVKINNPTLITLISKPRNFQVYKEHTKRRNVLMGDSKNIDKSLYDKALTLEDCQAMCDIISEKMNWPRVDCRAGRENTKRRYGSIHAIRSSSPHMIINKPSEGVILHELAHMCHRVYSNYIKSHGVEFKRTQEMLHAIWNGNMKVCA